MNIFKIYRFLFPGIGLCLAGAPLCAQNMNNPYSVYGLGNIDHNMCNRTSGMGNTGIALKSPYYILQNNPASIGALERSFFVVNIGSSGRSVQYAGDPINTDNRSSKDFGIRRGALAIKLNSFWASSISFQQYSNVNYKYNGSLPIEGTNSNYATNHEGDGGLNEFSWTNAFSIGKHLFAGIKSSVISGSINQTDSITELSIDKSISSRQQDYYSHLKFEYGLIYAAPINKKWGFSIGGRFSAETPLPYERTLTVTENGVTLIDNEVVKNGQLNLPLSWGAGIAVTHNDRLTIAADYTSERWSPLNIKGNGWYLQNSQRISGGVQLSKLVHVYERMVEKNFFQVGGFAGNSYLNTHDNSINEYGLTAGYGGVYRNLLYSVALEAGKRGTINNGLIKENYVQFTISLSYRDFLYSKGRKYD